MVMFDIVVLIDIVLLFIEHRLLFFHLIIILVSPTMSASDNVSVILFDVVDSTETTAYCMTLANIHVYIYVTYMIMLMMLRFHKCQCQHYLMLPLQLHNWWMVVAH